jgi:hypothetical protein
MSDGFPHSRIEEASRFVTSSTSFDPLYLPPGSNPDLDSVARDNSLTNFMSHTAAHFQHAMTPPSPQIFTATSAYSLAGVLGVFLVAYIGSKVFLPEKARWQDRYTFIWLVSTSRIYLYPCWSKEAQSKGVYRHLTR